MDDHDGLAIAEADASDGFAGAFVGFGTRLDGDPDLFVAALEKELCGAVGVFGEVFADGDALEDGLPVDREDAVAGKDAGGFGGGAGEDLVGGEIVGGFDAGDANLVVAEEKRVNGDGLFRGCRAVSQIRRRGGRRRCGGCRGGRR